MSFHFRSALLVAVALATPSIAQGNAKKEPPKSSTDVEVRTGDGSTIRMTIAQESLTVATRYGKLTVPMNEILRIDLGIRLPEGAGEKIDKAIKQLGSQQFKEREAATAELLAFGVLAYQPLLRVAKSSDAEVAQRANDLIKRIREKISAEKLNIKDYDIIKTTAFTIIGRIEDAAVKAKTSYFGEVKLDLADVRSLRSMAVPQETEVSVDAAKYCVPGGQQWLDTGVEVEAQVELTITVSGRINVAPTALAQQGDTGPAGNPGVLGNSPTGHPVGVVLGRIGDNGQLFLIGERYVGTPAAGGKLYLRIAEGNWGVVGSGSYTVKINNGGVLPRGGSTPAPGTGSAGPKPPAEPVPPIPPEAIPFQK